MTVLMSFLGSLRDFADELFFLSFFSFFFFIFSNNLSSADSSLHAKFSFFFCSSECSSLLMFGHEQLYVSTAIGL